MQIQPHIRIAPPELPDHVGQNVARLRVRRADGQASPALVAQLCRQVPDALGFLQDSQSAVDDLLARRRDARQIASLAHEDLEAQLILEQLDLLADARL